MNARPKSRLLLIRVVFVLVAAASLLLVPLYRQYYLDRALITAIHYNNAVRVDALLDEGANSNTRLARGKPLRMLILDMRNPKPDLSYTVLMWTIMMPSQLNTSITAHRASVHIVKSLLARHADVNATAEQGETALMIAVTHGRSDCVKALVEGGAGVNAKDANQQTSLMHAASIGDDDCVKLLITSGAELNAKDLGGHTALCFARYSNRRNHANVVAILKAAGAKE